MSTQSTIAHGENFHLYTDYLEKGTVWLSVAQPVKFSADPHQVRIGVPFALWEYLRTFAVASTELALKTDAQLRILAQESVAKARARYLEERTHAKEFPRRHPFHFFRQKDREAFRDPRQAMRELLRTLRRQRSLQRQLLAQITDYRNYPKLAAARLRRRNLRIEKRWRDLEAGVCHPRNEVERRYCESKGIARKKSRAKPRSPMRLKTTHPIRGSKREAGRRPRV